jgi:outer membrane protein assembly factor BamB
VVPPGHGRRPTGRGGRGRAGWVGRYKRPDPQGLLAFAGGFAITGGVLVTSDADATVRVLDIQDGAELWRQDISETNAFGPPAVAAGRIYVASATRLHVYAIPGS